MRITQTMAKKPQRLKKELGLLNVFMIATGTTLSAGFFLLPGIAFESAGPAITLAYIIAAIPLIPAMRPQSPSWLEGLCWRKVRKEIRRS